jgi:hypothetical protein
MLHLPEYYMPILLKFLHNRPDAYIQGSDVGSTKYNIQLQTWQHHSCEPSKFPLFLQQAVRSREIDDPFVMTWLLIILDNDIITIYHAIY